MISVKATREGLPGGKTATGWRINALVPFVALPSVAALRLWVDVTNPLTGKTIRALVLDVGPHFEFDDAYVFAGARPRAERVFDIVGGGKDDHGQTVTNAAGIDLGERVWTALGMRDNTDVEWDFV